MPTPLDDVVQAMSDDTDALAIIVAELRNAVSTGMSAAQVNAVKDTLSGVEARLKAVGKDPNNPVPPGPLPVFKKP